MGSGVLRARLAAAHKCTNRRGKCGKERWKSGKIGLFWCREIDSDGAHVAGLTSGPAASRWGENWPRQSRGIDKLLENEEECVEKESIED